MVRGKNTSWCASSFKVIFPIILWAVLWFMDSFIIEISSLEELENYIDFIEKSDKKVIIKNSKNTINSLGYPYIDKMLGSIKKRYADKIEICIDVKDNAAYATLASESGYKKILFSGSEILKEKIKSIGNNVSVIGELK